MRELELEYYVVNGQYDSTSSCGMFNIFNNICVYEEVIKEVKKYCKNTKRYSMVRYNYETGKEESLYGYEAFVENLRQIVAWQEWGRVEYEIGVCPWLESKSFEIDELNFKKMDCYEQFLPNKEMVADYVIEQYKSFVKKTKKINK